MARVRLGKNGAADLFPASHRHARISARKARLVMDLIRGESVEKALTRLRFSQRRGAPMIRKVVESAVANATQKAGLEPEDLAVHCAFVDEAATIKRWRPRSMGRAYPRFRRSCHLTVVLRKAATDEAAKETAKTESAKTVDSKKPEPAKRGKKKSAKAASEGSQED